MRCLVLAVMLYAVPRAHAEPATDLVGRPIVLAGGQLAGELWLDLNLAPGLVGKSTSLAPDLWFGALPDLTVGLIHSYPSVDRFGPGATFCVTKGDPDGVDCKRTYRGSGLDVRWSALADAALLGGHLAVAPRARFLVRDIDPGKPAVTFGALVRWTTGRYAITSDPYLELGLANVDEGNRHALFLPLTFAVQPIVHWQLALRTGVSSDLHRYVGLDGKRHVATDEWHIPIAIETRVRVDDHFDVGAMLGFASLLGPQNTAKERVLFFFVGWRS